MCSDKGAGVAQHGAADWSIDHCLHQRRLVGADAAEHPREAHAGRLQLYERRLGLLVNLIERLLAAVKVVCERLLGGMGPRGRLRA